MRHLTVETILDHIENKDVFLESAAVAEHLAICPRCEENAGDFQELLGFLRRDAANEPPAEVLSWGVQLFQPVLQPAAEGTVINAVNKVRRIARLVFDTFEQPLPAGIRHVGSIPRQLLFRAGDVDVDLRIEASEGRVSLAGQVLSESASFFDNAPVRLESHGVVRYRTCTNPVGEFSFDEIPQDTYHLSLDLPEGQVTLFCVHRNESILS